MTKRYLCIHSHFYQPPRENPWLEFVAYQESAYPFHDWNERISVECYRANGESRILDEQGWVVSLANNYSKISFNFGPTLLSWLEKFDPIAYNHILEGDKASLKRFGGHGSAIAQAYNHVILPLANRRDKETQVLWGLRDFERRFGREPESMWLPETAVDTESLEILAANGMKYVILAPRQAQAVRSLNSDEPWQEVGDRIDTRQPYLVRLPSGRSIAAFFYNGPISQAVAFEGLLHNGGAFAQRLVSGFGDDTDQPQLVHIATDGETYGHHHRHGDMALAWALNHIEQSELATVVNYGQYLELHPPTMEARVFENSSWSCAHGIERWKSDCGCNSGGHPGWHQEWRGPLRVAFDSIRDDFAGPYERALEPLIKNPWDARNDYIDVVLDRSPEQIDAFFEKWQQRSLSEHERQQVLKALEAQRHMLLIYTSCAWFFDELSGIETVQNIQYAFRALELAAEVLGESAEKKFQEALEVIPSNLPELKNGARVLEAYVKPARVDFLKLGAHFAVTSVFEDYEPENRVYCYDIKLLDFQRFEAGKAKLACGQAEITSEITLERRRMTFGVIHFGDHNVNAGIRFFESEDHYEALLNEAREAFSRADFPNVIRVLDRHFGAALYSLKDLFKDEQRRLIHLILRDAMNEVEERLFRIYRTHYPLMCYLSDLHFPLPNVFEHIAEFVQNRGVRNTLKTPEGVDVSALERYLSEAKAWEVPLDKAGISRVFEEAIEEKMEQLLASPELSDERLKELDALVHVSRTLPFPVSLGIVQNRFFALLHSQGFKERHAELWPLIQHLAQELQVRLP